MKTEGGKARLKRGRLLRQTHSEARMGERGQGALEYLMTYGWAILIIVIIGGALYALGVFNPATWTSSKRATGFASFQVKDWRVAATSDIGTGGNLTLVLGNKYGDGITLTGVNASRVGASTYGCNMTISTALAENQEVTVTTNDNFRYGNCATGLTTGKSYALDVQILFTSSGGIAHTDTGTITGKVE